MKTRKIRRPSDVIIRFDETAASERSEIALGNRVSTRPQIPDLFPSIDFLKQKCKAMDVEVFGLFPYVEPGYIDELEKEDSTFRRVIEFVKANMDRPAILFVERMRILRAKPDKFGRTRNDRPSAKELQRLAKLLQGVECYTFYDPDEDYKEINKQRVRRGKDASMKKQGRKFEANELNREQVRQLITPIMTRFIRKHGEAHVRMRSLKKWQLFLKTKFKISRSREALNELRQEIVNSVNFCEKDSAA